MSAVVEDDEDADEKQAREKTSLLRLDWHNGAAIPSLISNPIIHA